MRLVIDIDGTRRDVEVTNTSPTATLDDLIEHACGVRAHQGQQVWVDDVQHPVTALMVDVAMMEGTTIAVTKPPVPAVPTEWTVVLTGGLHAGISAVVPTSRPLTVGRSPQADITVDSPSVSWAHIAIRRVDGGVQITDEGSTNGTVVDGARVSDEGVVVEADAVIVAGGVSLTVIRTFTEDLAPRAGSLHNLTPAGTAPFNRPPRPGQPPAPASITPPERKDVARVNKFSVFTIIGPLVLAFAMVLVMGSMRYALISALSPVLGIGTWFEQKQRRARELKEEAARFAAALETFRDDVARAAAAERVRRRDDIPDPVTVLRRAALPTTRLWQRRNGTPNFLALHAGVGDVPWVPPVDSGSGRRLDDEVQKVVDESRIMSAPVPADLSEAGVVGIVGHRDGALAVARSLIAQAVVHCGPADLTVGVFCDQGRDHEWSWATWLPHVRRAGDSDGDRWVSGERSRSESLLRSLRDGIDGLPTKTVLLVIDSDVLTEGRDAAARDLLGRGRHLPGMSAQRRETQVSGIVLAASAEQLPAACTVVIRVGEDAEGTVTRPGELSKVDDVVLAGIDIETARDGAMALARFDDPELVVPGATLPSLVKLPALLGIEEMNAETIRQLWSTSRGVSTPIGIGEGGVFGLDLVKDGPHGLVGGTTGSGKSEFLRSLVAGLAARNDPEHLTFILIDFKGGAAFKKCERLPHTIGTVSNLDEQLADRALRALEAEMQYRQRVFASAGEGVDNLDAYLATNPAEPMPRLLLVIDEFAMLAKDYPDVLSSLVSVGAVGRTLGVHMILATQRPAGVVNDDILANTNLRVALRVQSRDDSSNVIGVSTAAAIGRNQQGRAFVKLGQDDITPVQTALVTGRVEAESAAVVELRPVVFGAPPPLRRAAPAAGKDAPEDLDVLIDAIVEANEQLGFVPPRPVWPEALDQRVRLVGFDNPAVAVPDGLPTAGGVSGGMMLFAVSDDPDQQRQFASGWDLSRGNLLLAGIPGSGTSTALASIALTAALATSPDKLDLLVLDMAGRNLEPLADLPHTVAYVGSGSGAREKQLRFLKYLRAEVDRRRTASGPQRGMIVMVDGLAALKDDFQDFDGLKHLEGFYRAYADGPALGMWFVTSTTRVKTVPSAMDEVTTQKWLFRLADPYDYSAAGIRPKDAPAAVPGRCVLAETKLQTHVATPDLPLPDAVQTVIQLWGTSAKQTVVGQLPEQLSVADLGETADLTAEPWRVPVGMRESDLEPAFLEIYDNEHALIAGPARSGKSTVLMAIASTLKVGATRHNIPLQLWGICTRRSPLATAQLDRVAVGEQDLPVLLAAARMQTGPIALLIDDAEKFDDADQAIAGLLAANLPHLHIFAAGRSDDLRGLYSHWTKTVRKARCGILLQPNIDFDGDLLGVAIPRTPPVAVTPGRGYLCTGGTAQFIQGAGADQLHSHQ